MESFALTEKSGYRAIKTAYSVRFFPELKDGERRPEKLKGRHGVVEGWEEIMPLELALYMEMTRRIATGILAGKGRQESADVFAEAKTVAEIRAIASCLWIEKQPGFPFRSIKKAWRAEEILENSSSLESANKRHTAVTAQSDRLKARGVFISEDQCGINFAKLDAVSLGRIPIPGLVDKVSIPLGILARLDGCELQTAEDVAKWFSSFLRMPRITHEFLVSLSEQLRTQGVILTSSRFRIDRDKIDFDGIRKIALPGIIPGCVLTFGDVAMMNECNLVDENSLRELLDGHSYNASTRIHHAPRENGVRNSRANISRRIVQAVCDEDIWDEVEEDSRSSKPEEVDERGFAASFDHYRRRLEKMRIAPAREAEIIESLHQGIPFGDFKDEIIVGYQAKMLNWVLRFGLRVHQNREEDIKEILSQANLNFARRADGFNLIIESKNPIRQFMFSCVFSAVQDGIRSGLITGIKMTDRVDRAIFGHHDLVLEALRLSPNTGNEDQIAINFPPTKKYPGRQVTFSRGDLEAGLRKLQLVKSFGQAVRDEETNEPRGMVDSKTPGVNLGLREKKREELLIRFHEILTRGFSKTRDIQILVNEMRLRMGLPEGISKEQLARIIGVTPSRVTQLVRDEGPIQRRLDELFGPGLRNHFEDEEILILLGRDQEVGIEDYL